MQDVIRAYEGEAVLSGQSSEDTEKMSQEYKKLADAAGNLPENVKINKL